MRIAFIITILCSSFSYSQNTGLYGKKLCVEFDVTGSIPVFSMITNYNTDYKNKDGDLIEGRDMLDFSTRVAVSYAVKNNIGLGIEFGYDFSNVVPYENLGRTFTDPVSGFDYYEDLYGTDHERLKLRTVTVMPKVEFTSFSGLLPIGLNHQLGIGLSRSKIIEHDYLYTLYPGPGWAQPDTNQFQKYFYNYENESFKGYTFMYALNVRTPISNRFMITYGLRYTLNLVPREKFNNALGNDERYWLNKSEALELIRRRRMFSLISFNFGFAIAL
ncbi:MAG: hypothetical protein JKY09_01310 [Crocinitomicaceae bacterium]|nr:hypothetical protein [Crocinitomicaceae bacterium]